MKSNALKPEYFGNQALVSHIIWKYFLPVHRLFFSFCLWLPCGSNGKESACNAGHLISIRPLTSPAACLGRGGRGRLLASGPAGRRPRRSRSFHSNRRGRTPRPGARPVYAEPAGAPSARGLGPSRGSGGVVGGEGSSGSTARLSAGWRRGLGLCLLRERQPRGGAAAGASPPPPRLRRTGLVPRARSGRAWGRELSPPGPVSRT